MTALRKGDKEGLFTYGEYRSWPDDERWELIDGVAFAMSPAPSRRHQGILTEIAGDFVSFFRSRPCEVYVSPFDVVLPDTDTSGTPEESDTVVQPDLVVVCDSSKLVPAGCVGAPDFVLEILSPATAFRDMEDKLRLYERHGVREYWIINPANDTLLVYTIEPSAIDAPGAPSRRYRRPILYTRGDSISVTIFPDLLIDLDRVLSRDR
jgi:Uma2 family endonuclease